MSSMVLQGYASPSGQLQDPYNVNFLEQQWDPKYRIKVRVICARAYHALFMVCLSLARDFFNVVCVPNINHRTTC